MGDIEKNEQLGLLSTRLLRNSTINGLPVAAGPIHFYLSEKLNVFTLAEDFVIQEHSLPKSTWVGLDEDSRLMYCSFPVDTVIQGHLCRGERGGPGGGPATHFYPSGRLKEFFAREDLVIHGIPCQASPYFRIALHENGLVRECTLSADTVIAGKARQKGTRIVLNENGEVQG